MKRGENGYQMVGMLHGDMFGALSHYDRHIATGQEAVRLQEGPFKSSGVDTKI